MYPEKRTNTEPVLLCAAATWQESIFLLFHIILLLAMLGLRHIFSLRRRILWACGTSSHKNPGERLASSDAPVGTARLGQRWKGPGSLRASDRHKGHE